MAGMKVIAATHSNFPRVGDDPGQQKLRRAYSDLEKGKIDDSQFGEIQDQLVKELVLIQESSGCDVVTDGMIRWYDHASHIASHLTGFGINGLLRFFDTNYYYRQPVAGDDIAEGNGGLADETAFTVKNSRRPVKGVLMGPYSLARMSQNKSKLSFEKLCLRIAEILGREIGRISSKGAAFIQIEEPAFVREPEDFQLLNESFTILARNKGKAGIILAFYFGNCTPLIDRLSEIPADMFGLDFTYSHGLTEKLRREGFPVPISFGILDGRNTKMESPETIAGELEPLVARLGFDGCHVTTSCGLEFLPRDYAIKKLALTSEVVSLLNG